MYKHCLNHGSSGKYAYTDIWVDRRTHYDALKGAYVPGEFKNPDTSINTVPLGKYGEDYIRQNADLESRPQIRSRKQLKCMCPELLDNIGEFKILNILQSYIVKM